MSASLEAFEAGAARLDAARTHQALARICWDQHNVEAARSHLLQAAARFEAAGLAAELERTQTWIEQLDDEDHRSSLAMSIPDHGLVDEL